MPHPVDIHVGKRIRQRRIMLGLSQEILADSVGVTFQQVQKYERGTNRVSSSRLFDVAKTLGTTISYFFEGLPAEQKKIRSRAGAPQLMVAEDSQAGFEEEDLFNREIMEIARLLRNLDAHTRKHFLRLIRTFSEGNAAPVAKGRKKKGA
ncbi:MAG: helix-turn-helix transcriptional regulator [Alphaproteobacteria bacterium]|nr:helix-turn-helix transcriptional regulator [Alphaproteobacteria bacterium]